MYNFISQKQNSKILSIIFSEILNFFSKKKSKIFNSQPIPKSIFSINKNGSIFARRKLLQQSIHKILLRLKINVVLAQKITIIYFYTTPKIPKSEEENG